MLITGQADLQSVRRADPRPRQGGEARSGRNRDARRALQDQCRYRSRRGLGDRPGRQGRASPGPRSARGAGHPRNHNWHGGRRGISRDQLAVLARALRSDDLREFADSDVWWDEVASIEYVGEEETFDIEVPGDHNFVCDDVIVHNSALAANFLENAAVRYNRPACDVLPRDGRVGAGAALHRLPGLHQGQRPAQGQGRLAEGHAGGEDARRRAAVGRRLVGPERARHPRQGPAARAADRRRARADRRRLPAADALRHPRRTRSSSRSATSPRA